MAVDRPVGSGGPVEAERPGDPVVCGPRSGPARGGDGRRRSHGAGAPLARAPDTPTILASTPSGTQELLPRRLRDGRTIGVPARPRGDGRLRSWSRHGQNSPWLNWTRVRDRTWRRHGRGTGPPDRPPAPDDPSGDTAPTTDSEGERIPWPHTYGSRSANASRTRRLRSVGRDAFSSRGARGRRQRQRGVNSRLGMVYHLGGGGGARCGGRTAGDVDLRVETISRK